MGKLTKLLSKRMMIVLFLFLLLTIIVTGNTKSYSVVANINRTKSLSAYHLVNKYDNMAPNLTFTKANNFAEVIQKGPLSPIIYQGTMTGYGPDCVGCGGRTGCSPYQDVRGGNIYFDDNNYGKIRIIATDKAIPCGSIFKISGLTFTNEEITAIALDRGGAIKNTLVDLLFADEEQAHIVGRQRTVTYKLIRWGW